MAPRLFAILLCLVLASTIFGAQSTNADLERYNSKVDELIDRAIDGFEDAQKEKMKAGFTSDVKRSYKKTK